MSGRKYAGTSRWLPYRTRGGWRRGAGAAQRGGNTQRAKGTPTKSWTATQQDAPVLQARSSTYRVNNRRCRSKNRYTQEPPALSISTPRVSVGHVSDVQLLHGFMFRRGHWTAFVGASYPIGKDRLLPLESSCDMVHESRHRVRVVIARTGRERT